MKILIGVDFSEESLHAAGQGFALAEHLRARHKDESDVVEVFVAYIEGSGAWHPSLHEDSILDDPDNRRKIEVHTREFLQEHFSRLPGENLDYTLIIEEGRARQKLAEIAERLGADWLFVGRSGSGALVRMTLGSTSYTLANSPPCNLVIAHEKAPDWQGAPKIAVGIDFSEAGEKALDLAISLAQKTSAQLHLVHVIYPAGPVSMPNGSLAYAGGQYLDIERLRTRTNEDIDALLKPRADALTNIPLQIEVITGYPKHELVAYAADKEIEVLVMGTVGRSALSNFLLGSVAAGVVKHSPCSVYLSAPIK